MVNTESIRKDLTVHAKGDGEALGSEGSNVGTVDHMDGEKFIKLNRKDSQDGQHHWIPLEWVEKVDDKGVYLSKSADEVLQNWTTEKPTSVH